MNLPDTPKLILQYALFVLALLMALTLACTLDTRGIGPIDFVTVSPPTVCPGDPVDVCWDLEVPLSQENCACPNGGNDRFISCVSSSDCGDGRCVDGMCVTESCWLSGGFSATGCPPRHVEITLTSDPTPLVPPVTESNEPTGCRQIRPERTTTITMESAGFSPPFTVFEEETHVITVIDFDSTSFVDFPFSCPPPAWVPAEFTFVPNFTDFVSVTLVTNVSGRTIILSSGRVPPVRLENGRSTTDFNGRWIGVWQARLAPEETALLLPPRCGTEFENPWPGLRISVDLECSIE